MISIGIDPGKHGGAVVVYEEKVVDSFKLATAGEWGLRGFILHWNTAQTVIFIESVPKWCGEDKFAQCAMTGSAMATMFGSFEFAHGVCIGMGIQPVLLTPVKWQNLVQCRNRRPKLERTAWKNKLKDRARELYPDFKGLTLWNSDAVLIAHAGFLHAPAAASIGAP